MAKSLNSLSKAIKLSFNYTCDNGNLVTKIKNIIVTSSNQHFIYFRLSLFFIYNTYLSHFQINNHFTFYYKKIINCKLKASI